MEIEAEADLNGKRVLVVEDDYLLANEICHDLRDVGAHVLGPAPTAFYATQLIGRRKIDAAVLDVRLHGVMAYDVADLLQSKGVPILFATGYDKQDLPSRFRQSSFLQKPLNPKELINVIIELTSRPIAQPTPSQPSTAAYGTHQAPAHHFARALAKGMARIN